MANDGQKSFIYRERKTRETGQHKRDDRTLSNNSICIGSLRVEGGPTVAAAAASNPLCYYIKRNRDLLYKRPKEGKKERFRAALYIFRPDFCVSVCVRLS